jgi:hypothetical protein
VQPITSLFSWIALMLSGLDSSTTHLAGLSVKHTGGTHGMPWQASLKGALLDLNDDGEQGCSTDFNGIFQVVHIDESDPGPFGRFDADESLVRERSRFHFARDPD